MSKVRHLAEGQALPEWFLDALQEMVGTYASPNFEVSVGDSTHLQVVAGTNNDQVCVSLSKAGIAGWRHIQASISGAVPGGLPAGDHDVFVTAYGNVFSGNPMPPPTELDSTVYDFFLVLKQSGMTPSGTAGTSEELYRKVATFSWTGSAIASVKMLVGGAGGGGGLPPGVVEAYAGDGGVPAGWLACDGSAVNRETYAALFAVVGTTYGVGDGSTTFNLPDLRGRMVAGLGSHADVNALGNDEGSVVGNRRPKHPHSVADPTHVHAAGSYESTSGGGPGIAIPAGSGFVGTAADNATPIAITGASDAAATGITVGPAGVAADAPAYLVLLFIIKT